MNPQRPFSWRRALIAGMLFTLIGLAIISATVAHALKQLRLPDGTVTIVVETQEEALQVMNQQNALIQQLRQQLADKRTLECNLI